MTENENNAAQNANESPAPEAAPASAPEVSAAPVVQEAPAAPLEPEEMPLYFYGTGRRKTSVARVRLKPNGSGQITIIRNGKVDVPPRKKKILRKNKRKKVKRLQPARKACNSKPMTDYFNRQQDQKTVLDALKLTKTIGKFDIFINVNGGGQTGQAGAARLGIARALINFDQNLLDVLRVSGFLTRDARVKERKKYGQRGARASYQYSKR